MSTVERIKHDRRIKGPCGSKGPSRGMLVHCTVSEQRQGTAADRHGIIDFLDRRGLSVPMVVDDDGATLMLEAPCNGIHCAGLTDVHGVEMIGQAYWTREQWLEHRDTIVATAHEAAWFLAERMRLPVTIKNLKRFVVGHVDDHVFGGTSSHVDPGKFFPWDVFYAMAIAYAAQMRWSITATKADKRRARTFRLPARKRAFAYARKLAKRGYRVVIQRKPLPAGDLEED